jgi:hypothetical protein
VAVTRIVLDEMFAGDDLDRDVWSPYYLPHWSSRAESAATYAVRDGELHLTIPPQQGLWCAALHDEPIRISCIQSANGSGSVGSTRGPLSFKPGLVVREKQAPFRGYTPKGGRIEIRMRGRIGARSMVAFWMAGLEDEPERSGEILVAEIFGDAIRDGFADVGTGVRRFRDPALHDAFATVRVQIDVATFHTYGLDWRPGSVEFSIDGREIRRLDEAPAYPLQLFVGVFDFPGRPACPEEPATPELVVSHVRGRPLEDA